MNLPHFSKFNISLSEKIPEDRRIGTAGMALILYGLQKTTFEDTVKQFKMLQAFMRRFFFKSLLLSYWVLLLPFLGCKQSEPVPSPSPPILVSIAPYAYFVDRITLHTLPVQVLVPSGANPHLFEPTPKLTSSITQAKLWIRIDEPFEYKLIKVLKEQNPTLSILNLSDKIPLLNIDEDTIEGCNAHSHHKEEKDRHIWLSPKLAKIQAQAIKDSLSALFPAQAAFYQDQLNVFLKELDELDQEITALLSPFQGEAILASHPAFGYFCKDYQLKQLSIECEGKDPRPQQLAQILQRAKESRLRCVLIQAQYNNKGALLIAEKLQLPVYSIDPYSENYPTTLLNLAHFIAEPTL